MPLEHRLRCNRPPAVGIAQFQLLRLQWVICVHRVRSGWHRIPVCLELADQNGLSLPQEVPTSNRRRWRLRHGREETPNHQSRLNFWYCSAILVKELSIFNLSLNKYSCSYLLVSSWLSYLLCLNAKSSSAWCCPTHYFLHPSQDCFILLYFHLESRTSHLKNSHFIDFFLQTLYILSHDVALIIASFILFTKCLNLIS